MEWDSGSIERKWYNTVALVAPLGPDHMPVLNQQRWGYVAGTSQEGYQFAVHIRWWEPKNRVFASDKAEVVYMPCGSAGQSTFNTERPLYTFVYEPIAPGFYLGVGNGNKEPVAVSRKLRKCFSCGFTLNAYLANHLGKTSAQPLPRPTDIAIPEGYFVGTSPGGVTVLSPRLALYKDNLYYLNSMVGTQDKSGKKLYVQSEFVKAALEKKFPGRWEIVA